MEVNNNKINSFEIIKPIPKPRLDSPKGGSPISLKAKGKMKIGDNSDDDNSDDRPIVINTFDKQCIVKPIPKDPQSSGVKIKKYKPVFMLENKLTGHITRINNVPYDRFKSINHIYIKLVLGNRFLTFNQRYSPKKQLIDALKTIHMLMTSKEIESYSQIFKNKITYNVLGDGSKMKYKLKSATKKQLIQEIIYLSHMFDINVVMVISFDNFNSTFSYAN